MPFGALPNAGDSFAIDVAGMPLVFVRGQEGELNGFVNACRHRGARLKPPGASNQRALICPYHSWTYGLDGTLRGRPSAEDFPHAPASDCSLARVPVAEALGFVWAIPVWWRTAKSARIDIDDWLGRFGADLRSWGYDSWVPFHQHAFDNAANWKIPFEANLETYHFQYAHRNSIAALFYDNLLMADHDRQHQRLFLPKRSIERPARHAHAGMAGGAALEHHYYFFPATFILHEGDHANAFTVLPESPGRSRVIASTLVPELPKTEKSVNYWRKNVESFWGALDEDFALGVSAQSTLRERCASVAVLRRDRVVLGQVPGGRGSGTREVAPQAAAFAAIAACAVGFGVGSAPILRSVLRSVWLKGSGFPSTLQHRFKLVRPARRRRGWSLRCCSGSVLNACSRNGLATMPLVSPPRTRFEPQAARRRLRVPRGHGREPARDRQRLDQRARGGLYSQ